MLKKLKNRILDASVVASFDRSGFERHLAEYGGPEIPADLSGMRVLVTGANSGIGKSLSMSFARRGAQVLMLCRNPGRANAARDEILSTFPQARLEIHIVDMSRLEEIRRWCQSQDDLPLDALIHNAGVLVPELAHTVEGLEVTFATHVVGPHLMTQALLPSLTAAAGRVITVSSGGMYPVKLDAQVLEGQTPRFDGVKAYAQAKRAQVILNKLWSQKVESDIHFSAMHPGWAATPGVERSLPRFWKLTEKRLRSAEQGADTAFWLAALVEAPGPSGLFWFDRKPAPTHVFPWTQESEEARQALWGRLETLTSDTLPQG